MASPYDHLVFIDLVLIAVLSRGAVVCVGLEGGVGDIPSDSEALDSQPSITSSVSDEGAAVELHQNSGVEISPA